MRVFLCYILPPIAVLTTGKINLFLPTLFLTILFWVPGVIYAVRVINKYNDEKLEKEISEELYRFNQMNNIDNNSL